MSILRLSNGLILLLLPLFAGCLDSSLDRSLGPDQCRFFDARQCYFTTDENDVRTMHIVGLHMDQRTLDSPKEGTLVDVPWHEGPVEIRDSSFVATGPALQMTAVQTAPCPECRLTLVNVTLDGLNESPFAIKYVGASQGPPALHLKLVDVNIKDFGCGVCLIPTAGFPRPQESSLTITDSQLACGRSGIAAYVDWATLRNVTVTGCSGMGVFFDGREIEGHGVTLSDSQEGGSIYASESASFAESVVEKNRVSGLYIQSPASTLTELRIIGNGATSDEPLVGGLFIRGQGTLHDSWIEGNEPFGVSTNAPAFDATNNYWGHPDGPTPGYALDRIPPTPKIAGDRIDAYSQYVPYLSSPP